MSAFSEKLRNGRFDIVYICLAITVSCLAVYCHTLTFGITNSDDDILITKNLAFLQSLPNIFSVFHTDAFYLQKSIDLYRPIQSATFILDAQWGMNPVFAAHCTNVVLHTLSSLTLFRLLRLLDFRVKVAFCGALVFAVHYLFMCAVAWLPARGDLLLTLFVFLSVASFIKIFSVGSWKNYLLHGIFFFLAIFSKESAVVLPALLALYLWSCRRTAVLNRYHLLLPLFYLTVQVTYFKLKSQAVVLYNGDTGIIPLLKNIRTLPETLAKFFLPLNMSTLPAYQLSATTAGVVIIAGLFLLHLFYRARFHRKVLFYAGWTVLFIVPGMLYYPAFYTFAYEHLDHRAYLSCCGLLFLTLNLVQTFDLDRKRGFHTACLLLLIYLVACNFYFSKSYRNPAEFALRAIRTNPKSAHAYSIFGNELYLQGRDDEALDNLNRSIAIFRKMTPALQTRALIYRKRGQSREALADLDTIIAFEPAYDADVYTLRAQVKTDLQDYPGAESDYLTAVKLNPEDGLAAAGLQELQRSVRKKRVLPDVEMAQQYNRQGIEAGERGDFKAAEALFRKALTADPGFSGVNLNLGNVLNEQGRTREACDVWKFAAGQGNAAAGEMIKGYCGR